MIYLVKVSLTNNQYLSSPQWEAVPFDLCKVVHNDQTFPGKKIPRNILPKEEKEAEFWWILTKNFPKANDEEKSERWKMAEIFQEWLVGLWLFTVYFSYWSVI